MCAGWQGGGFVRPDVTLSFASGGAGPGFGRSLERVGVNVSGQMSEYRQHLALPGPTKNGEEGGGVLGVVPFSSPSFPADFFSFLCVARENRKRYHLLCCPLSNDKALLRCGDT